MAEALALAGLTGPHELMLFVAAVFVLDATPGVDLLLTVMRTLQAGGALLFAGLALRLALAPAGRA